MTPEALGRRNHQAMGRIVSAATRIARAIGDPELRPLIDAVANLKRAQDPQILALRQREAVADLLDGIAKHAPGPEPLTPEEQAARDVAWAEAVVSDLAGEDLEVEAEQNIPEKIEDAAAPAEHLQDQGEGDALPPPRLVADEASASEQQPKEQPKHEPKRGRKH